MAQAAYYVVLALGTAAQVKSTQNAAKAQAIQYREQAKDEQSQAKDREIERKRRLVSALSAQAAEAGHAGVDPSIGSRRAIALDDIMQKGYDSQIDSSRTNRRSLLLRNAARDARRQGDLKAAGIVLNSAAQALS